MKTLQLNEGHYFALNSKRRREARRHNARLTIESVAEYHTQLDGRERRRKANRAKSLARHQRITAAKVAREEAANEVPREASGRVAQGPQAESRGSGG